MVLGGLRTAVLGALLLTVGLVPVTAGQETCAGAGPAEICVADPLVHDAGQATLENGDVSAEANGGIVTGAGSATFVLDYVADTSDLSTGDVLFNGQLRVLDGDGNLVARETFSESLVAGATVEDEVQVVVETVGPLVGEGAVEVLVHARQTRSDGWTTLGQAQSVSPIKYTVAPPSDAAERTTVASTIDAGSFDVGPASEAAEVIDGELVVASDTSAKLVAEGELSSQSFTDIQDVRQRVYADLLVRSADFDINEHVSVRPIYDRCYSTCSVDAQTVPVELSVVIPGDLEEARHKVDVRVSGSWSVSWYDGTTFRSDSAQASAAGANELIVAGS